ncbi:MAG: hypothetical protein CMF94_05390 [Candidatus Marinimicrobia bacterium]|nr:hypothetical protein [Candidatus Neomarinimicrobiota bacterium]
MLKITKIFNLQFIIFISAIVYSIKYHLINFISKISKENSFNVNSNIFANYLKKNSNFWKNENKSLSKSRILITNFVHHPGYTITESIIAKQISQLYNLETSALLNYNDYIGKKIIKSFDVNNFLFQPQITFIDRFRYLLEAYNLIIKTKNIQEFISMNKNNINYGRCIYDHILRNTSSGTIKKINFRIYFFLAEALFYNKFYNNLFSSNKFEFMIMSETQFLPSNIVFQNALENNVKVISRIGGPEKIGIRLYTLSNEKFQSNIKILKNQFDQTIKGSEEFISNKGFEYITELYEGRKKKHDQATSHNFNHKDDEFNSSKLLEYFKWNKSKKICVIYSHNLFDGNYYNEWRIFKDNLTWLRKTLLFIKNNKNNINWIVKDHPSDYGINRGKTTTHKEFQNIIGENKNIKFFPKNFQAKILKEISNCLLTSQGSAGIEFPCFGIPSVICGDAFYQGLGFTLEPKNENEYYNIIENIDKIIDEGLDENQINNARAAFCFSEELTKIEHMLLFDYNISRSKLDLDDFFFKATKKIVNYDEKKDLFKSSLKNQLLSNNRHLIIENNLVKI